MDIIFPEYEPFTTKVIFYRIPKNASTSIYDHLGHVNVIKNYEKEITERVDQRIYRNIFDPTHLKFFELQEYILSDCIFDYFSFVVVRNPWDRAVSMYKFAQKYNLKDVYKIKEEPDFETFCEILRDYSHDKFFMPANPQSDWICSYNPPKRILRFENLNQEFSDMVNEINLIGVDNKLPHKNSTKHLHYSEYYNSRSKKLIFEAFEKDIDTFKYTFGDKEKPQKPGKGSLKI